MSSWLVCVRTHEEDLGEHLDFEVASSSEEAWKVVQEVLAEHPPPLWDEPYPLPPSVLPWPRGTRIRLELLAGTGEARIATVLEGMDGYRTGSEFATVSVEV